MPDLFQKSDTNRTNFDYLCVGRLYDPGHCLARLARLLLHTEVPIGPKPAQRSGKSEVMTIHAHSAHEKLLVA